MPPESHVEHRECPAASDSAPRSSEADPGILSPDWAFHAIHEAGDVSLECDFDTAPETNRERHRFLRLVKQYSDELKEIQNENIRTSNVHDLFEVFCHPQSSLTHQCQQLGFKAKRFSLEQGDLICKVLKAVVIFFDPSNNHHLGTYGTLQHVDRGQGGQILMEVDPFKPGMNFRIVDFTISNKLLWE